MRPTNKAMHTTRFSFPKLPLAALLALGLVTGCGDDGDQDQDTDGGSGTDSATAPTTGETTPTTGESESESETMSGTDTTPGTATDTVGETEGDTEVGACQVPAEWSAPEWDANTVDALALQGQLGALAATYMRAVENGEEALTDVTDLSGPWEEGTTSLAEYSSPEFQAIIDDAFAEFVSVIEAGQQDLINEQGEWMPGADGGIFGDSNRGLNEGGLELRQIVDKGGFGGGPLYNYALQLTTADITPATIDAIAAVWGANAMLDPTAELDDAASYSYQMGFFGEMADALIAAKAHAGEAGCEAERDQALVTFFRLWEQSMMARAVYYSAAMAESLVTATTDSELAEGLHELAEGLGLAAGFYGMPDPEAGPLAEAGRTITDAQIETFLGALGVDLVDLGSSSTGEFVESLPNYEAAVEEAEGVVMDVYGVDAATIATYRMPTPG